ncbi:hypothetical protein VOLCADRAFT_104563 [Volvox carteri f. nagariensis]|uniref:FAS1 domain-containing protein n=1 Tax=Volvox carteri f. nagariensis TaxID=3068 RepID=D8TUG7_VOLCA|nr:uncharacterized protein VOLCADRAFT_104563 [Volvox carteri f. nagariensis]EFJ48822.1 hypothetical protein VOLCADRAFT_104563 [Volvox carteri f. nagariensis]|eukprot:XP_002950154.1 hypothetical protein VOLCADRAFT_104563 [Volvox carteri f. nagariensis]
MASRIPLLLALLCVLGASVSTAQTPCAELAKTGAASVLDVLAACPELSTTYKLLKQAPEDFHEWLLGCKPGSSCSDDSGPGRTLFLPTDEAWDKFFAEQDASGLPPPDAESLAGLMLGHALGEALTAADFPLGKMAKYPTLLSSDQAPIGVQRQDDGSLVVVSSGDSKGTSVVTDIRAGRKVVIHIIIVVLVPFPWPFPWPCFWFWKWRCPPPPPPPLKKPPPPPPPIIVKKDQWRPPPPPPKTDLSPPPPPPKDQWRPPPPPPKDQWKPPPPPPKTDLSPPPPPPKDQWRPPPPPTNLKPFIPRDPLWPSRPLAPSIPGRPDFPVMYEMPGRPVLLAPRRPLRPSPPRPPRPPCIFKGCDPTR